MVKRILLGLCGASTELRNPHFWPNGEAADHDILCLHSQGGDISYVPGMTWQQVLDACPTGWMPDIYVHRSPEYNPIPFGLENASCFTVGIFGDWNLAGLAIHSIADVFDLLVADYRGCEVLRRMGFQNVEHALLWGYNPQCHRILPGYEGDENRDIDVLFIGSFNYFVHKQRCRMLGRLARLADRYRVVIAGGVYGEAYTRLMNRAKIVFNHSVRGECNMRAYEAAACGALLFNEADNAEIGLVFRDGKECVLYTEDNLEDLLAFYLAPENAVLRQRIAAAGHARAQQHTDMHHLATLLAKIEPHYERWCAVRTPRPFCSLSSNRKNYQFAIHCFRTGKPEAMLCAEKRLAKEVQHNDVLLLRGLIAAECGLFAADPAQKTNLFLQAQRFWEAVLARNPQEINTLYSLSVVEHTLGATEQSRQKLEQLHSMLKAGKRPSCFLFYPRDYMALDVEIDQVWLHRHPTSEEGLEEARQILLAHVAATLSELSFAKADFLLAAKYAQDAAIQNPANARMHYLLARALRALGKWEEALAAYQTALQWHPFFFEAVEESARLLMDVGQPEEATRFLKERLTYFQAAAGCEELCQQLQELLRQAEALPTSVIRSDAFYLLAVPSWQHESVWQAALHAFGQHAQHWQQARLLLRLDPADPLAKTALSGLKQYLAQIGPYAASKILLVAQPLLPTECWKLVRSANALLKTDGLASFWEDLASAANLPIYSVEDLQQMKDLTNQPLEKSACL